MNIKLTPEQEAVVRHLMESGGYQNEEQVVGEALRFLDKYDPELLIEREIVKAEIQKGIDQLDRGEGIPWNVDDFIARGEKRLAERRQSIFGGWVALIGLAIRGVSKRSLALVSPRKCEERGRRARRIGARGDYGVSIRRRRESQ